MFTNYRGKKVLVTGHSGFKGAWLSLWLQELGAKVAGLALAPSHPQGVFSVSRVGERIRDHRGDIRDAETVARVFAEESPEIVFHLAAQPLVLESYQDPVATVAINVQGTAHILEAIRRTPSVRAAVMITTDKCYENQESPILRWRFQSPWPWLS